MAEILVMSPTFHPEKVGTPVYATDLVRGLSDAGHDVRVVTNQPYYPSFRRFEGYDRSRRRDVVDGVPIHRLPTIVPPRGRPIWRAVSEFNMLVQLVIALLTRRIARSRHVVVISPGVPLVAVAGRLLRRRGGRLLAIIHDLQFGLARASGAPSSLARLVRRTEVGALGLADVVAPISEEMAAQLRGAGLRREVNVVGLWTTIRPTGRAPEPNLVMYSGNLGRKQGVEVLLEVAEHVGHLRPDVRLVIRGDGSERAALIRRSQQLGLANVAFEDFVSTSELAASLESAPVHLVPQLPEAADHTVPSKVFNVLAVGRRVLAMTPVDSTLARLATSVEGLHTVAAHDAAGAAHRIIELLDESASGTGGAADRISRAAQQQFGRSHALREYLRMLGLVS